MKGDTRGAITGIIGGIGLGLLLGSGFPGTQTTIAGAILTLASLMTMAILSYKHKMK